MFIILEFEYDVRSHMWLRQIYEEKSIGVLLAKYWKYNVVNSNIKLSLRKVQVENLGESSISDDDT